VRNHRQRDPPKSASKTLDRASYEEIIRDIRRPREKPRSMTLIALIRHAATGWNEGGRVQSTTDVPLSENGRETVRTWQAPPHIAEFDWISSPLSRAVETATILSGFPPSRTDERLIEMDWAVWEGMTITELKAEIGNPGEAWRAGGLDFKAPGGESQREVQYRLLAVFRELVDAGRPTAIVCHRGVVRATYSLAAKWNQTTPWPDTLADDCTHLFHLQANGHPEIAELNVPLTSG
jgi:broad specificity phosphatase PhoE